MSCNVSDHHGYVLTCSNFLIALCIIWHLRSLFPILLQNQFSTLCQDISILLRLCLIECFLFCIYCCLSTKLKCYSKFLLKVGQRCWIERSNWKMRIMNKENVRKLLIKKLSPRKLVKIQLNGFSIHRSSLRFIPSSQLFQM